jgi:hypothetical protein
MTTVTGGVKNLPDILLAALAACAIVLLLVLYLLLRELVGWAAANAGFLYAAVILGLILTIILADQSRRTE